MWVQLRKTFLGTWVASDISNMQRNASLWAITKVLVTVWSWRGEVQEIILFKGITKGKKQGEFSLGPKAVSVDT